MFLSGQFSTEYLVSFKLEKTEEKELEIRYGQSYSYYKKDVLFLIPRLNFAARYQAKK